MSDEKWWRNLLKMLKRRGYDVSSLSIKADNSDGFPRPLSISKVPGEDKLYLQFTKESIKKQFVDRLLSDISKSSKEETYRLIVVGIQISKSVQNALKAMRLNGIVIETFTFSKLQIDVTKNRLSDTYEICSDEEKKSLIEQYKIYDIRKGICTINEDDPQCKYIGALEGDVVKVKVKSMNIPEIDGVASYHVTYKYVYSS
jgi:DNA-directed RNA polymerase subunit H (RpoH/RPB5)